MRHLLSRKIGARARLLAADEGARVRGRPERASGKQEATTIIAVQVYTGQYNQQELCSSQRLDDPQTEPQSSNKEKW